MRRLRHAAILAVVLPLGVAGSGAPAQDFAPGEVQSAILTLDQERLFNGTLWGKRATRDIEAASADLVAENRRIEADLTAEEKSLTERRPTMTPEAFRAEADAFDTKVVAIREAQDAKARSLQTLREQERQTLYSAALPVLTRVMRDRGASVILDVRSVFVSLTAIDVTDDLIRALDAELGAGPAEAPPAEDDQDDDGQTPQP